MHRQFESELHHVRKQYEQACQGVVDAKDSINGAFREKVRTIKEKSALFFAKLEMKLEENNQEVLVISKMFREWQETLQGPTLAYEAKFYTFQAALDQAEAERESEFGMVKDLIKKLVLALEDKASQELMNMSGYKPSAPED